MYLCLGSGEGAEAMKRQSARWTKRVRDTSSQTISLQNTPERRRVWSSFARFGFSTRNASRGHTGSLRRVQGLCLGVDLGRQIVRMIRINCLIRQRWSLAVLLFVVHIVKLLLIVGFIFVVVGNVLSRAKSKQSQNDGNRERGAKV